MKTLAALPQKIKMAALLAILMVLMVFTALSMRYALRNMDQTLTSVYKDRLQPAVELVYLNENLYAKRLLLETYLSDHSMLSMSALRAQLRQTTQNSYQRINMFEKTELTGQEAQQLHLFKTNLRAQVDLERSILQLTEAGQHQRAVDLFEQKGYRLFQRDVRLLHGLVTIQHETGQQAVETAHRQAAGGTINTTFLIGLAIIIGLLIQQLLVKKTQQKQSVGYGNLN
ncbi:MCP four helix bundle domain-containing protein [Spirosoma luteum]|uniref:MCP four helix bundle domain-containing protein n=1 Tax=Spirosoma luteum TaxID=431553 RepID=UPI0003A1B727|nr:MCP four helix bundle domain-containing protein [Spirosoma luteum]